MQGYFQYTQLKAVTSHQKHLTITWGHANILSLQKAVSNFAAGLYLMKPKLQQKRRPSYDTPLYFM